MLSPMIISSKVRKARPWRSLLALVAAMPLAGLAQEQTARPQQPPSVAAPDQEVPKGPAGAESGRGAARPPAPPGHGEAAKPASEEPVESVRIGRCGS
jgi:hypothetical protein